MKLPDYLSTLPRGGKSEFARKINISKSFLRHLETGMSRVPPQLAKKIEQQTKGKVSKAELRPDLWA